MVVNYKLKSKIKAEEKKYMRRIQDVTRLHGIKNEKINRSLQIKSEVEFI